MSKKISQLTAKTTNDSTDDFVFRRSDNNYRIAYSDLVAQLGVISGLTTGYIPVATSATAIGNSYLHQTAGSIIIADGKTVTSVNGFSVLNFNSGAGISAIYDDGAGTTGTIQADSLASTFAWTDGVNDGGVTAQATNLLVHHTGKITLDAPILECLHLTVSTLPFVDTSQYLKSSTIVADGNNLSFTSGHGIDTTVTVGSDVLNIGTTNANVINYGNSSTVHNFLGTAIYETQTNSYVTDKLITLNSGGAVASGIGVGFEIEENAVTTGYFKTNAARTGFSIKSPANTDYTDFVFGSTVARTKTFQDTTSTIAEYGDKLSVFAATTSAELAGVISDETGSGALVFATSPTLITPVLGTPTSGNLVNCTGYTSANVVGYQGYSLNSNMCTVGLTPVDATTYYFGGAAINSLNTVAGSRRLYIPKAGTIKAVYVTFTQTAGSAETSAIYVRLNDTADTLISNAVVNNAAVTTFSNTSLNIAVVANDFIEYKWITPTWATNPTAMLGSIIVYME